MHWMNQRSAAEYLHVTPRTVRAWTRKGILRARRVPGTRYVYYAREELDALIDGAA